MSIASVVALVSAFAIGILIETLFSPNLFLLSIGFGVVYLGVWWWHLAVRPSRALGVITAIACVGFFLGVVRMEWAESLVGISPLEARLDTKVEIEGVVVREPDVRTNTQHLYVKVADDLLLVTTDPYLEVAYGDRIIVSGIIKKPTTFVTDLGRSFNYPGYLLARGVEYRISFAEVEVVASGEGNPLYAALLSFKQLFMRSLSTVLPEPQFGLGVGLLLGVKQALGDSLEDAFRQTGIIHIVVLSGYNVMLVVAFVLYVFSFFLSLRARVVARLVAITLFALLVGLSATVVRASIMAGLFLIAHALGRTYDVLRGLLFAGMVMLLINPYLLVYDVGFQLSFLATLGLILVAPHFELLLAKVPTRIGVHEFMIATIATQIAVLPLLLYQIGELSLVAVVVNVLVLPMVPVAMLFTFATGLSSLVFPFLASLLVYPTYASLSYIIEMATWWAGVPFASVVIPPFPFYFVPIAYGFLGVGLWWWHRYTARKLVSTGTTEVSVDDWTIVEEADNSKLIT